MNSNIFSIEIFIDRIRLLAGEKCLFPSTILKLFNYEPTQISTVDRNVQSKFHEYLHENTVRKLRQIDELKDADGNFVVRQGKSVLFPANILSLMAEFNTIPIYVLVCDDFFDPSHLVGVITVKVAAAMERLASRITASEAAHTASEDVMGKYPVVNLMGDAVGAVTLKLRLVFIGANLAPHLPQDNRLEVRPRVRVTDPVDKSIDCGDLLGRGETVITREIGCQATRKRGIRVQVTPDSTRMELEPGNLSKVGLTIDPNDPVLKDLPPMIYNSQYGNSDSDSEHNEESPVVSKKIEPKSKNILNEKSENLPILNALLNEIKSWKSHEDVSKDLGDNRSSRNKSVRVKFTARSKSEDCRIKLNSARDKNHSEFLKRLSQPKQRPESPCGIVPRDKGWIRSEPEYSGPSRSGLDYKLTRTQIRRIELRNPALYHKVVTRAANNPPPIGQSVILAPTEPQMYSSDFSSPTNTPVPRVQRNPLVPPLFAVGASISLDSSMNTLATARVSRGRPPQSPGKENQHQSTNNNSNNNNRSVSYDTNDTINEAEQYLNLNPVQSNRSPHMSIRSHAVPVSGTDQDEQSILYESNNRMSDDNRTTENRDDYSDGFNQSYSSQNNNHGRSQSRRHSNGSLMSQTSEWRTDYSIESNTSQSNQPRIDSSNSSLEPTPQNSPTKNVKPKRRSLLSNSIMPGGRFFEDTASSSIRTLGNFRPSFNESLEISNIDSTSIINGDNRSEQIDNNPSMLRPGSAGADITSFTKVTKYERSLVPGFVGSNNNVGGMNVIGSTVGSLRTDDSQILTSESYY